MQRSRAGRAVFRSLLLLASVALFCSLFGKGFLTPAPPGQKRSSASIARRASSENGGFPDEEALRKALRLPRKESPSLGKEVEEHLRESGWFPWEQKEEEVEDYWSGFWIGFLLTGWILCFMGAYI